MKNLNSGSGSGSQLHVETRSFSSEVKLNFSLNLFQVLVSLVLDLLAGSGSDGGEAASLPAEPSSGPDWVQLQNQNQVRVSGSERFCGF